jgi:malonyl CoA-acyl carrier protein transacylase
MQMTALRVVEFFLWVVAALTLVLCTVAMADHANAQDCADPAGYRSQRAVMTDVLAVQADRACRAQLVGADDEQVQRCIDSVLLEEEGE